VSVPTQQGQPAIGDVLRYHAERDHCREGWAVVNEHGAFDTFWGLSGGDRHRLTEAELATAEVVFSLNDFRRVTYAPEGKQWDDYHPDDRQQVPSQHWHCRDLFIRPGAAPDLGTRIANARKAIEKREAELTTAQHRLEWAREDLARLEAV
jgi:hypothetical protein